MFYLTLHPDLKGQTSIHGLLFLLLLSYYKSTEKGFMITECLIHPDKEFSLKFTSMSFFLRAFKPTVQRKTNLLLVTSANVQIKSRFLLPELKRGSFPLSIFITNYFSNCSWINIDLLIAVFLNLPTVVYFSYQVLYSALRCPKVLSGCAARKEIPQRISSSQMPWQYAPVLYCIQHGRKTHSPLYYRVDSKT